MTAGQVAVGARRAANQLGSAGPALTRRRPQAAVAALGSQERSFAQNFNGFFGGGGFGQQHQQRPPDTKLYDLLGVEQGADEAAIKSAYKKQAMKHHPDRGGEEGKFKEISKAYEVLSDSEKRKVYDAYGEAGLEGMDQGGPGGQGYQGGDPFDLFSQMFGFQAQGGQRRGKPRTPDQSYELQLSLEELYTGTTRSITFNRNALCKDCNGFGGKNQQQCKACKGQGQKVVLQQMGAFVQQFVQTCDACDGKGYIIPPGDHCGTCKGTGIAKEKSPFDVVVDAGAKEGTEFRFRGQADEALGHTTGDVVIVLREKPHKTFHRVGDSLIMVKNISLTEALCGVEFSTTFLDGEELIIRSTPGEVIKPKDVMLVEGKGMPRPHGQRAGNLFVRFEVDFPERVESADQEKLAEVLGGKPLADTPPLGSEAAKKLSKKQQRQVMERIAEHESAARARRGGGQTQCAQQ